MERIGRGVKAQVGRLRLFLCAQLGVQVDNVGALVEKAPVAEGLQKGRLQFGQRLGVLGVDGSVVGGGRGFVGRGGLFRNGAREGSLNQMIVAVVAWLGRRTVLPPKELRVVVVVVVVKGVRSREVEARKARQVPARRSDAAIVILMLPGRRAREVVSTYKRERRAPRNKGCSSSGVARKSSESVDDR